MQGIVINGIFKCKDWRICMKNMHSIFWNTMQILEERIPILPKVPSNYTNQIGRRSLHIHKSLLIFPSKCNCTYTYKAHKKLVSVPKKWNAHKSMHSIFSNSMGISFLNFIFWNSCDHFYLFYFILFYFSPWYLTSTQLVS
jgi:hypothetical protein